MLNSEFGILSPMLTSCDNYGFPLYEKYHWLVDSKILVQIIPDFVVLNR